MNELQIQLHLKKIQHLFEIPDINPFSNYYYPYSTKAGMDFIIEELYEHPSTKKINLNILLPSEQITPGFENKTIDAIGKYSEAWAQDAKHKMARAKYKGTRGLLSAIAALIFLDGAAIWLGTFSNIVLTIISERLIVAAWVLMWYPVDYLTQEFWIYKLERQSYQALKNITVKINPETIHTEENQLLN